MSCPDKPATTPTTWAAETEPTADEFLPWFLMQSEEAQKWMLREWQDMSRTGMDCIVFHHAERLAAA